MQVWTGLGNPGAQYAMHRHNVGFMALDAIAEVHGFAAPAKKFQGWLQEGRVGAEKVLPGESAEGNGNRRRRSDNRLRGSQDERGPTGFAGVVRGGRQAPLPRPSPRTRRATRSSTALTSLGSSSS